MKRQLIGDRWCDLDGTCGTYAQHYLKPDYVEILYLTTKGNWVLMSKWPDRPLEDWAILDPCDAVIWLIREKHEIPPCLETVLAKLEI